MQDITALQKQEQVVVETENFSGKGSGEGKSSYILWERNFLNCSSC